MKGRSYKIFSCLAETICVVASFCLLSVEKVLAQIRTSVDVESGVEQLELPIVPDSLKLPSDRASFLLRHFWDNMDFADQRYSRNEAFMEQNFVNFISVMMIADTQSIIDAVLALYERAEADQMLPAMLDALAEDYLYGVDSPMRNEDIYMAYLDGRLASPSADEAVRLRAEYQKAAAMRNRPGTQASDFSVVDRNGREFMLSESVTSANTPTLLIFYDPDCEDCHLTMRKLSHGKQFSALNIVAVYAGDDEERWLDDSAKMPEDWIVVCATMPIEEDGVFDIPVTPTIYLIDKKMNVILKNAVLEQVEEMLNKSV